MPWHFEFYRIETDGRRGSDKVTDESQSLDAAIVQAESMLANITFPFGKANLCLIKSQDGSLVREVRADVAALLGIE